MTRKYSAVNSNEIAIDRELGESGYDVVKEVRDNLTALIALNNDSTALLAAEASAVAAAADAAADLVLTNADVVQTGLDLVATNQDTLDTAADLLLTNADVILTGLDVDATNADVISTGNDVTYAEEWANKAEDSLVSVAAGGNGTTEYSALHWSAKAAGYAAPVTATTTQLADITHAINTGADKVAGYPVFNTTTGIPVWATGNTDGAVWNDATGATAHTPV